MPFFIGEVILTSSQLKSTFFSMSRQSEVAQINRDLSNMMSMTLPQLQNLNQQINNIINRGRIFTEVERTQRKEKYRVTTRNGIEINREYLGCEDDVTKTFEYVDLSSQNQSDLTAASNILGQMISVKTGINAVIKFLHQNADNSDIKISIDDALSLTDKFIGPVPNDHPLSPKSD